MMSYEDFSWKAQQKVAHEVFTKLGYFLTVIQFARDVFNGWFLKNGHYKILSLFTLKIDQINIGREY